MAVPLDSSRDMRQLVHSITGLSLIVSTVISLCGFPSVCHAFSFWFHFEKKKDLVTKQDRAFVATSANVHNTFFSREIFC